MLLSREIKGTTQRVQSDIYRWFRESRGERFNTALAILKISNVYARSVAESRNQR